MGERLINTHDQLSAAVKAGTIRKRQAVAVSYYARPTGRMGWGEVSHARVWSPFFNTDEKAQWSKMGSKTFSPMCKSWREAVEDAKKWASNEYAIKAWARNRFGDFVPAEVNKKHPLPKRES